MEAFIQQLKMILSPYEKIGIAFSGGVDSTLLLKAAVQTIGASRVVAFTINSPYIPNWEIEEAKALAMAMGVTHHLINLEIPNEVRENPENRCYLCKRLLFSEMLKAAEKEACQVICDGTNFDDTKDYRPGLVALKELGVLSPLKEAHMTKADIRVLSKYYGLPTWDKPPYACLLTRIPYGETVTKEKIAQIEAAEMLLMAHGFRGIRVRHHGELARIEIDTEEMTKILDLDLMKKIHAGIGQLGFKFVTLDMGGYQTGCYNPPVSVDTSEVCHE
jgi:uncharacterized protein